MRLRTIATAAVVVAIAAVCARLGFWQIARLHEKQALNARLKSALALPPVDITNPAALPDSLGWRRVRLRGLYDEWHQVLLAGRSHAGAPGVHVVTPLLVAGKTSAVLVDRGWLPSPDAATARPEDYPEPGPREVVGIAEMLPRGVRVPPMRSLESDSITVFSTPRLEFKELSRRLPHVLAPFFVRELPAASQTGQPVREPPRPYDEFMHLSYAIQWFTFAAILLGGSVALAWSRRRGRSPVAVPPSPVVPSSP